MKHQPSPIPPKKESSKKTPVLLYSLLAAAVVAGIGLVAISDPDANSSSSTPAPTKEEKTPPTPPLLLGESVEISVNATPTPAPSPTPYFAPPGFVDPYNFIGLNTIETAFNAATTTWAMTDRSTPNAQIVQKWLSSPVVLGADITNIYVLPPLPEDIAPRVKTIFEKNPQTAGAVLLAKNYQLSTILVDVKLSREKIPGLDATVTLDTRNRVKEIETYQDSDGTNRSIQWMYPRGREK